jgi:hypothetical protein
MDKFSMAMGITLLNRKALYDGLNPSGWGLQVHNLVHLSNNGRGWNGMSPKK